MIQKDIFRERPSLLVVTSSFPKWEGDTESGFIFELCRRLTAVYDIHVLAPHGPGLLREEKWAGLHIVRFRYCLERWETLTYQGGILPNIRKRPWRALLIPFFLASEWLAVVKVLRNHHYVAVHAHWLIPQGVAAYFARYGVNRMPPVLCTCHGSDIFALQGGVFAGMIQRLVITGMDGLVGVSRALQHCIIKLGAAPERTASIAMGVDLSGRFVPSDHLPRGKQLLFVGRLVRGKGLSYLLRSLHTVLMKHPETRLLVVGEGPEEGPLKREAAHLGLKDGVSFLGALPNDKLPAIYQASEVVIFPSVHQEGFGLVLVEALGCGCAVLATDFPSVHDIIEEGRTGFLVPPKDAPALAARIIFLLDHPEVRQHIAEAGRKFVLERYDWSVVTDQYQSFIANMIKR